MRARQRRSGKRRMMLGGQTVHSIQMCAYAHIWIEWTVWPPSIIRLFPDRLCLARIEEDLSPAGEGEINTRLAIDERKTYVVVRLDFIVLRAADIRQEPD